jgi:hypothetical protein
MKGAEIIRLIETAETIESREELQQSSPEIYVGDTARVARN